MGQGRTVWIVRLPVNAISDVRDVRSARATDERERRDQFTDWRDGSAPKPASRTPKHRAECAAQAVFNGRVDGHTVQEPTAPQVSPVGRGEVSPVGRGEVSPVGRGQVSPVGRAETVQQLRQEQQTTTPPPRTAHERERDAGAQAAHGGGGCDVINAEQEQPHSPTADQRVRGKQRGQRASEHRHPRTREMLAHLGILASTHDALLAPYRSLPDDLALRRSMWLIVGHRNGLEIETDDPRDLGIEMSSVILKVDLHKARNPPGAAHHRLRGATDQITTVYNDIVRLHEAWVREGSPSAEQRRTRETEHKQREWQRQLDAEKARDAEREAQRVADEASRREQAEIEHRRAVERQEQERRQAEREAQLVAVLDALDVQQRGDLEQQRRDIIESKYPREMHDDPNAQRLIDNARKHQVAKALAVSGLTCPHRRALVIERG